MPQSKKKPVRTQTSKVKKASQPPKKPAAKALKPKTATGVSKSGPPAFRPEVRIYSSPEVLFQEAAHRLMQIARESVNERGRFVAAISGGSTPRGLFQQLTEEPYLSLIPWSKTFLFWVDERHVPLDHETSNYHMTQDYLLSKVPLPKENLFPATNGSSPVDKAAAQYESKLRKFFAADSMPRFDFALMGMGEDGHTASLFPGMPQVNERDKWVVGYFVDKARKERVSLTFPVLNASRFLMVLVEGEKKAGRMKEVLEGPAEPPRYPIQYLRPLDGHLLFALDSTAASRLKASAGKKS